MAQGARSRGFDVTRGIYTLITPDESGYVIARDEAGVPVALFFTTQEKAEAYRRAAGQQEAGIMLAEGAEGVQELTEELVEAGIHEAFLDHTRRTRQPVVLDLAAWAHRAPL